LTGFTVEKPTVKWALDAGFVDNLSADSQIGSHMCAIGMEGIDLAFRTSEQGYVLSRDVHLFCFAGKKFF
jgi:hypothetical protein